VINAHLCKLINLYIKKPLLKVSVSRSHVIFLKELGYVNFANPDVYLKDIFKGIGLFSPKNNDYQIFKTIIRVAHNVGTTPYNVDNFRLYLEKSGILILMKC